MSSGFAGYPAPTSNTTYTPNQFFDVVLPNSSRGVVRLVGYMLRKVLGWSDVHGNPQQPEVVVSYRELEERAGISHSMIREALDEAIAFRYLRCLRDGSAHGRGTLAQMGHYELCWDESETYITDPDQFQGFYAGNGNLTYIPNTFFDHTIPNETLAVIRVVGAIIRHTIGFQTRYGFRRQEVKMSFTELQRRTGIASPTALNRAIQAAIAGNHLVRVRDGVFDRNGGMKSQAATYAIRWADGEPVPGITPKSVAAIAGDHSEKCSGGITPKSVAGRSEKCSGDAPKSVAGDHSEKCSDIEITHENNTSKEQQQPVRNQISVAADSDFDSEGLQLLIAAGFDQRTARELSQRFPVEQIRQQCEWLPIRNPTRNRLGLLRRAIEETWPAPAGSEESELQEGSLLAHEFVAHYYAGWAGYSGVPATTPSASERKVAHPYVTRLQESPAAPPAADLGRRFAEYARRESEGNPRATNSFPVVLKLYGEEFFLKAVREGARASKERLQAVRQSHEQAHSAAYQAWIGERVGELQSAQPEAFAAFQEAEAEEWVRMSRLLPSQSKLLEITRQDFQSAERRLERWGKFLAKHHPALQLPDFWAWDAAHNPEPFQPPSTQASEEASEK